MAQLDIAKIKKMDKDRNTIHEKVYTTYSTFDSYGHHYVQIDTYGRSDRAQPGTVSQSLQLDETSARYLFDLLKKEYNFDSKVSSMAQDGITMTMQKFLVDFEAFCQTPGIESGAARSYAYAMEYLCDYLRITVINTESINCIRCVENDIKDKNSVLYNELLAFLSDRGQKSYLSKGWIRSGLNHFFDFIEQQ